MKRLFIAVLAMASLVACNKNEVLETVSPDAITFEGAWVDNATRSEDPSYTNGINDKFELKEFDVYGFMTSFTGVVFDQELVSKSVVNGEAKWSYANLQYWTPGKQYWFAALAPAGGYSLEKPTTDEAAKYGVGKVTFVQPNVTAEVGTVDLIYSAVQEDGPASVSVAKVPVKLQFKHLLSKVKFSFKNGFTNENATVKITNIKMKVPAKGSIDLAQQDWWTTNEWELVAGNPITMEFGDMEVEKLEIGKTTSSEYERLTFPTDPDHEYVVEFDAELFYGAESAYTSHLTTTITGAELKIGKAYNFVAEINNENIVPGNDKLNPIEFTVVEIKEWGNDVEYNGGAIVTGPFNVGSVAELNAAIQQINDPANKVNAAEIKLTNNINLSSTKADETYKILINTNLTFDLNGKTINGGYYEEGGYSYSQVFEVRGGNLTIVDSSVEKTGKIITEDATYSIPVWARGDKAGYITIKDGYFENAGDGCDLIYISSPGKITIEGGEYMATTCAGNHTGSPNHTANVRAALNIYDGKRAEASIVVMGGKFYEFDPANNVSEGAETNFVAPGYMSVESTENNMKVYTVVPQKFEVGNEAELFAAVTAAKAAQNPTITLTNNVTVSTTVNVDCKLNLNLNGYTLTNKLANVNTDVIVVTSTGDLTVYGEGTVEAVTGNDGYAIISEGTLTINEGTYKSGIDANDAPNAVIYARGNGKVYVNGGNFPNDNASKFVLNKKDADRANTVIEVKGGSYGLFNPANNAAEGANTSFLAAGYNVVKTGDAKNPVYTVLAPACTLAEDAAAVTIFNVAGTLNGADKTLSIDEVGKQFLTAGTLRLIEAKAGSTINNLYIDGKDSKYENYGIRAIFMVGAGDFALDKVHIKNVTYTLNDDSAAKTLVVTNSTLEGWTSYNPATTATFTNVKFQVNVDGYGTFRPHGTTTLTNCDFADGFVLLLDKIGDRKITLNNCTYNGTAITAENLTQIWPEIVVDAVVF